MKYNKKSKKFINFYYLFYLSKFFIFFFVMFCFVLFNSRKVESKKNNQKRRKKKSNITSFLFCKLFELSNYIKEGEGRKRQKTIQKKEDN